MFDQPRVRGDQVAIPLVRRHRSTELLPFAGKEARHAAIEPIGLRPPSSGDGRQDDRGDPVRMPLRTGKGQRGTPRSPSQQPAVNVKMRA